MSKHESLLAASKIDGWLSDREMETLYDFAAKSEGPIVEIGSHRGRSTAAIALGSMAGNHQPVFAIDNFSGVENADTSSPELLRANLDAAGVNGLVRIVGEPSFSAIHEIPESIGMLFVDGAHDYQTVMSDISLYSPRLRIGGRIVVHDANTENPGVLKALDETLTKDTARWNPVCRVDSAVVFERRQETPRYKIFLAIPGQNLMYAAAIGLLTATRGLHDIAPKNSGNGFDDMNTLWVDALNMAHRGEITHFAMLHSDINPSQGWIDILISEMERTGSDLVSTIVALKDWRGLTSTGIGDDADHWNAFRRFTIREIHSILPETFTIADTPHPDKYLLHNTGCWVADLRNPAWRTADENNRLIATLSFPIGAELMPDGTIEHRRESEDWYFSRMVASLGLKTAATRKVSATHFGTTPYTNEKPWGHYLFGDEATRNKWEPKK